MTGAAKSGSLSIAAAVLLGLSMGWMAELPEYWWIIGTPKLAGLAT
jgi:hypothetical protein